MKLKDLPKYCASHYCYGKSYSSFFNCNNKTECEYQHICRDYFHSTTPMSLCKLFSDLEDDIKKDEEE